MSLTRSRWFQQIAIALTAFVVAAVLLHLASPAIAVWLSSTAIALLAMIAWRFRAESRFAVVSDEGQTQDTQEWTADEWKNWARQQAELLEAESDAVTARERRLAEKLSRYHEILEFPVATELSHLEEDNNQLSEADQRVNEMLEAEAASVYEKIRTNAYLTDGKFDVTIVRKDALNLIQRVAKEYQPHSKQPLLETSFNQLARAFSRICLHSLVLLEQLPLDVRNYTLNELFAYFQKAVKAYGTYQQVAPWMQRLGRTAYAGRLAAGANPVTLGAWWLASEVAQRGAKHVVSNVVDRRAIAVLHDLVSVFGTEVANIYGPGYRQRDAAWIYGSELTELLSRVPVSRHSLKQALQEITQLPLKCEYDRIYLYRCLATSTAAGFRLSDPASLSREQRETIAVNLERFVTEVIHGVSDNDLKDWVDDTEARLDLKLKLNSSDAGSAANQQQVQTCLQSIQGFSQTILADDSNSLLRCAESLQLLKKLPLDNRQQFLRQLSSEQMVDFDAPDLDPESELLPVYLEDLVTAAIATQKCEHHHFNLLLETAMHFRLSRDDAFKAVARSCRRFLQSVMSSEDLERSLNDHQAVAVAFVCRPSEMIIDAFTSVEPAVSEANDWWKKDPAALFVLNDSETSVRSVCLVTQPFVDHGRWSRATEWSVQAVEGYVYDDCRIELRADDAGNVDPESNPSPWARLSTLNLGGTLLNRKFERRFASLLPVPRDTEATTS